MDGYSISRIRVLRRLATLGTIVAEDALNPTAKVAGLGPRSHPIGPRALAFRRRSPARGVAYGSASVPVGFPLLVYGFRLHVGLFQGLCSCGVGACAKALASVSNIIRISWKPPGTCITGLPGSRLSV